MENWVKILKFYYFTNKNAGVASFRNSVYITLLDSKVSRMDIFVSHSVTFGHFGSHTITYDHMRSPH